MKTQTIATAIATIAFAAVPLANAGAQDAPRFMAETFPTQGVQSAWQEFQDVMTSEDAALDAKTKELIGLGVAAQIPCDYCVNYHTKAAKAHGATAAEVKEALASAALVRQWSTMLNGSQYDEEEWQEEVDAMFSQ